MCNQAKFGDTYVNTLDGIARVFDGRAWVAVSNDAYGIINQLRARSYTPSADAFHNPSRDEFRDWLNDVTRTIGVPEGMEYSKMADWIRANRLPVTKERLEQFNVAYAAMDRAYGRVFPPMSQTWDDLQKYVSEQCDFPLSRTGWDLIKARCTLKDKP